MCGQQAQLLYTDPPYCLLTRRRKGGDLRDSKHRKIDRDPVLRFESVRDYRSFTQDWLGPALENLAPSARAVLWTNVLGKAPIIEAARGFGFAQLWGEFIWAKRTTQKEGNEQLLRVYEIALVLARAPPAPRGPEARAAAWSVVTGYDDEGEGAQLGDHPHHKPFSALEPLLRDHSQPGDLVLDPFAGSGSIPMAALRLGRRAACIELKPDWAARVEKRLSTV